MLDVGRGIAEVNAHPVVVDLLMRLEPVAAIRGLVTRLGTDQLHRAMVYLQSSP